MVGFILFLFIVIFIEMVLKVFLVLLVCKVFIMLLCFVLESFKNKEVFFVLSLLSKSFLGVIFIVEFKVCL